MANIGAGASVVTFHGVATPVELSRTVGNGVGVGAGDGDGVGEGAGFRPYMLAIVVKFRPVPEIHVLVALFP